MRRFSIPLAAVPLFLLSACSAPVTEVFDASDVSWSPHRLVVRRREPLTGPMIFPGFAWSWSAWSLEMEDPEAVGYR